MTTITLFLKENIPVILISWYHILGMSTSKAPALSNANRILVSKCVIEESLTHYCACRTPPVWMWEDIIDIGISIIIIKVLLPLL